MSGGRRCTADCCCFLFDKEVITSNAKLCLNWFNQMFSRGSLSSFLNRSALGAALHSSFSLRWTVPPPLSPPTRHVMPTWPAVRASPSPSPPLSNCCYRDGAATRRGHLKSNHALRRHVQSVRNFPLGCGKDYLLVLAPSSSEASIRVSQHSCKPPPSLFNASVELLARSLSTCHPIIPHGRCQLPAVICSSRRASRPSCLGPADQLYTIPKT